MQMTYDFRAPLHKAIAAAGGVRSLARRIGISHPSLIQWMTRREGKVPAGRVLAVEAATECRVTRYELRPDLYPPVPPVKGQS